MSAEHNQKKLDIILPEITRPGGAYLSDKVRSNIAYVDIQFSIKNGEDPYLGGLGENHTTEKGFKAMQLCALNVFK